MLPDVLKLAPFFIRRRIFGRSIPLLASFKLSYLCNMKCLPCPYHLRSEAETSGMSRSLAEVSLDAVKQMGTQIVVFEGGEPLLWRDGGYGLGDLIAYARKRFLRVAVTTNGTLPLPELADIIWVSLDGLKENHDRLRSGSFDKVWSNLQSVKHRRLLIHFTINRDNRRDIRPLLEKLKSIPAFSGMTVQIFYPYGQGETDLSLTGDERRAALEDVIRMKKDGLPVLNSISSLRALISNSWRCHDDMLVNVDPDGTVTQGCYVKSRGRINCRACGFSPVCEASGALDLSPGSLFAGWSIFLK